MYESGNLPDLCDDRTQLRANVGKYRESQISSKNSNFG